MKTLTQILLLATVGTLTGCGANASDNTPGAPSVESASVKQQVTVLDCQ
jgi:outer membrane lipopolysaccharide assembly protein LptE/RlpB